MKKWGNALQLFAPETFKADCVIYQRSASNAPGEFRRARVNEASNDNLARVKKTAESVERERRDRIRVCITLIALPTFLPS